MLKDKWAVLPNADFKISAGKNTFFLDILIVKKQKPPKNLRLHTAKINPLTL